MLMAAATEREQLSTQAAIVEHTTVLLDDFAFNELGPAADSTRMLFNLGIDSLAPFMGSYFQVCVHACLRAWMFHSD